MQHPGARPRSSLARSTLIHMSVCIASVIALSTLFSYLHLVNTIRTEALGQLERYVKERSEREQAIFVLAEDNHTLLKRALAERIQAWGQQDPVDRFEALFARLPDGSTRSRMEGFDGTRMPGGFISEGIPIDAEFRRRFLSSYEMLAQYGPAFRVRFKNTYISLPEGALALYWPEDPTWVQRTSPRLSYARSASRPPAPSPAPPDTGTPPSQSTATSTSKTLWSSVLPENNAMRRTVWSGIYWELTGKNWMVTISTPVDLDGHHVATISHDVLVRELMERALHHHLPGTYNLIFRDDGMLIAHPELMRGEASGPREIPNASELPEASASPAGTREQRAHLKSIFDRVKNRGPGQVVLEHPEYGEYVAVTRLEGPGWNFVTVLPESMVTRPAFEAARYILIFGVVSLVLVLGITYWVLRVRLSRPLLAFTRATDKVAAGDFKVELDTRRDDELGQLAHAFQLMTDEVHQREEALRQANGGLESRVEERTRELKEVHRQLVDVARQAGMAEVATSVLHNVGNVLNSVRTSAALAREQLIGMHVDQVGKVATLLEEHQADLPAFLTQDERGKFIVPFVKELGQRQQDERQEILSLLSELHRHTDHIGTIIRVQQDYASFPRLHEPVHLAELVEEALRISEAAFGRSEAKVVRVFASLPPVMTDKNKVLMILVNLISNARYALEATPPAERLLTLELTSPVEERVRLAVIDNGVGIAPELLTRIFQYGFTTRRDGHGFGLHSSALAAQDMGGKLVARSEGPGRGATFTLELPYEPRVEEASEPQEEATG